MPSLTKIAIVGRPNVGKSTLFNRLVGHRRAIVDDVPGVTRDRQYGKFEWDGRQFSIIDTGGFFTDGAADSLEMAMKDQAILAIEEADAIVFVVDGRVGLSLVEEDLARLLRKREKRVILAVNKVDTFKQEDFVSDFYKLGFNDVYTISAETSYGISDLLDALKSVEGTLICDDETKTDIRLSIIGKPNVGKSTLLNALLGTERAVVHQQAGTTRDSLSIQIERGTQMLEFVDTAGIRRHAQTTDKLEKISILRSLHEIASSHMALVVVDAKEGLGAQDLKVLGYAHEKGRATILVFNKWDLLASGSKIKPIKESTYEKMVRQNYVPILAVSAKSGRGIQKLYDLIDRVHQNYVRRIGTGELNRVFQKAVQHTPPPTQSGKNIHISYVTQIGAAPIVFVLFCNHPKLVREDYLRYLERVFRKEFNFEGVPIRWVLRKKGL